jgi:two-component system, sensor histidine kinase LadS
LSPITQISMRNKLLYFLLIILPFFTKGQSISVNQQTENIDLQQIGSVFKDVNHQLIINQLLQTNQLNFRPIYHLNIGISYVTYWVKFTLKNTENKELTLRSAFESNVNDTLFLYKVVNQKVVETTLLGEYLPFSERKIKYRNPIFEIKLKANERADFYLKSKGDGQPKNLTAKILSNEGYHQWVTDKLFFLGMIYGIMLLILLFNLSFYLVTRESIYIIFSLQVAFSVLGIAYFDGFVYQYIFPNSGYWSNETVSVALCGTFYFSNRFTQDFFSLKTLVTWAYQTFGYANFLIFGIFVFSFVHPLGFNTFVVSMTAITSLIALLLFVSIINAKRQGFSSYIFGLIGTVCLIIFGSLFQCHIIGLVPDNFLTQNAMHLAVVTQSVFFALAVNDKFRAIREENTYYQIKLVEALNQYSQNLITNIEAERQRLAVDIHDGLGQNLLVIRNKILLSLKKKSTIAKLEDTLESLLEVTTEALDDTRAMSHNLRPPILNTMGLTVAIQSLVEKMRVSTSVKINLDMKNSIDGLIQKELEINVYRILQESFNNAFKHAQATKIDINIIEKAHELHINFQDNGNGFDQGKAKMGQGLLGIKERVSLMKGTLFINSEHQKGTQITINIPVKT